jgi:hypothetical protein
MRARRSRNYSKEFTICEMGPQALKMFRLVRGVAFAALLVVGCLGLSTLVPGSTVCLYSQVLSMSLFTLFNMSLIPKCSVTYA